MAEGTEEDAEALAARLGLPRARCQAALFQSEGDVEQAFRDLLLSGEVDPANLDPERVPDWAFTEAQLARTRKMMKGMNIPDQLHDFFEATLGQVGADDKARSGLRGKRGRGVAGPLTEGELEGRRLKDPELGLLQWSNGWWGKTRVAGFDWEVALFIEATGGVPPDDQQRVALRHLDDVGPGLRYLTEAALSGYYRGLRTGRPRGMPDLVSTTDIWQQLDGPIIRLPLEQGRGKTAVLRFGGAWDENQRFDVVVRDGRIHFVGREDDTWE